jgi:hypothetical protein
MVESDARQKWYRVRRVHGSTTKAIDAMHIDNQLGGSSITDIPKGIQVATAGVVSIRQAAPCH